MKRSKIDLIMLLIGVICLMVIFSSCSSYIGERSESGCGVWYPKHFERGHIFHRNGHAPSFGRF